MLEPADPWLRPRRPGPGARPASLATTTVDRPGDHVPLPAVPVAAGWARRRGIELLRNRGVHPDTADVVSLLISELVTNALLHGLSVATQTGSAARCARCGGQLCLNLREEPGAVLIEVFDAAILPPRRTEGTFDTDSFTAAAFDTATFNAAPFIDPAPEEAAFDTGTFEETAFNDTERGRGLMLIASLSEEQGYYLPPDGGKVVWCVVKADI